MKIVLANSDAFNASSFSQELTGYAAGYKVPNVEAALDFIAPRVPVPSRRFEYSKFGDGSLLVDTDDERAVYGSFKTITSSGEIVQAKLVHRGLTAILDDDEISSNFEQKTVEKLKRRLLRNELARAAAIVAAAASNSNKKWMPSGEGKSTPDGDLQALVSSVADACGISANRILFGETAWTYRYAAMVASSAPGEGAAAKMSPAEVAMFLGIDELRIAKERIENANKSKSLILPANKVFAFNAQEGVDTDDPSTFKRFVGGEGFKVFVEEKAAAKAITVHHYSLLAQTGVGACKSITVSNS